VANATDVPPLGAAEENSRSKLRSVQGADFASREDHMQLSEHFSLAEMTSSDTARRIGDPNQPGPGESASLVTLCREVLEPVRTHFGRPVRVNSGYRSLRTNRAVGSKDNSQHRLGEAADIEIDGLTNAELAFWIRDNLDFDQVILESYRPGVAGSGWVHVSYRTGRLRKKCNTMTMGSHGPIYSIGINP
jgi:zinc D-Ala-D-Ala carboxypeptidase